MDFGVGVFHGSFGLTPGEIARTVEDHGLSALYFPDHTHIPASRESPWPAAQHLPPDERPPLPPRFWKTYDLFVALADAAAATSRLRIGSGVCLVAERDPIVTAKTIASIDQLSGGRVEFGVGAGWNREEMRNHGTDPRHRMEVLAERVEAIRTIWTEPEASYSGRFVSFERIWCDPKPLQRPHPPVLVGGAGAGIVERVLRFGDAWFPMYRNLDVAKVEAIHARADRRIYLEVIGVPADARALEDCERAGALRASHYIDHAVGPSALARSLERWEAAIADYYGG